MITMKKSLIAVLLATTVLSVTACANQGTAAVPNAPERSIQVNSTEQIKVAPDVANISLSVITQAKDIKACQQKNSEDLSKVIDLIKKSGIDEKSIQTSNYDLQPIYDWDNNQEITGYQMNTDITVSNVPIDQVGTLLSASVEAGISKINQVEYLSSQYDKTYGEALQKAMETAKTKADSIAASCGCTVSDVLKVEERSDYSNQRALTKEMAPVLGSDSMTVAPGEISVEAQVSVTYKIK